MRPTTASLLTAAVLLIGFIAYNLVTKTPEVIPDSDEVAVLSESERAAFRDEVRAYLLDSPEVLMEAIQVLEDRQRQEQVRADADLVVGYADEIFNDGYSWVGGNPDGDITLVEFQDYRCGYCRRAHDEVHELVTSDGNIRLVIKEFPILGEQSLLSARLAIATLHKEGPEKYKQLADFLITFNGNLTENTITGILERFEITAEPILAHMNSDEVTAEIGRSRQLAGELNISGTPTFVLGNEMLRGYVPLANMRELVKAIRAERG